MNEMRDGLESEKEPAGEKLPYGVEVERSGALVDLCPYEPVIAAVSVSAANRENAVKFVQYLLH